MSTTEVNPFPRVLRIRRSDEAHSHVLLHVSCSDSAALELNITATEGESPYTTTLRQSQLKELKAKNYPGSDGEWRQTVLYALGLQQISAAKSELFTGVETSASIVGSGEDDKELVIAVRKRIQTITQKLGTITLQQDDERGIELFEWSNLAVTRADVFEKRFHSLLDQLRAAEDTISQLNKQLEDFISSKSQHEQQLMSDFVQLLNEKKLKIRNQQRLLASARVDREKLATIRDATAADGSGTKVKGERPKRPAKTSDQESDSEDGFEKMDVDTSNQSPGNETDEEANDEEQSTPQPLENEGDTTSEDETYDARPRGSQPTANAKQMRSQQLAPKSPPPRRELPFARRIDKKATRSPQEQPEQDVMGGETDDDEL
ncbi:hypothetical protein BDV18DRAFT_73369 [Aspergillus unguis]